MWMRGTLAPFAVVGFLGLLAVIVPANCLKRLYNKRSRAEIRTFCDLMVETGDEAIACGSGVVTSRLERGMFVVEVIEGEAVIEGGESENVVATVEGEKILGRGEEENSLVGSTQFRVLTTVEEREREM
jgi:hypothetical protein